MASRFFTVILMCLILFPGFYEGFGQVVVHVSKVPCMGNSGYFIEVGVRNRGNLLDSTGRKYYDYSDIYRLPDSIKIEIIEKIFNFTSDSSLCCKEVRGYENMDYPGCFNQKPSEDKFSIRVEALFIINRIAYNSFTSKIGCYPVLYDTETLQEVNDDNCLISIMVKRYKEWFKIYKETEKLPDYYFLNRGRIKWWGKHFK
jgi:hypothetical protein